MDRKIKIIHLEDSLKDSELIHSLIESGGIANDYFLADNEKDYLKILATKNVDIILCDYSLPGYGGAEALKFARENYSTIPFIYVSGTIGEDAAINAMLNGATDYVLKNKLERLIPAIKRALYEHDIERKQRIAEEELRVSETRYRRLFETAKDGIIILDAETGMIKDVNPFLIEKLGYSKEQFVEKEIWEIGFFKDIIANKDKFLELQAQEYVRYEDLPLETIDGKKLNVEFVSNVYTVYHQKVIQCNIRDITERKKTEKALKESEKKFRSYIENAPDGVFVVNENGHYLEVNKAACQITGYTEKELLNMNITDILPSESLEAAGDHFMRVMNTGYSLGEFYYKLKNGTNRMWSVEAVKLSETRFLGFVKDITEQKQSVGTLRESEQRFKSIFENIQDVYYETALDGTITELSPSIRNVSKYKREELLGKSILDFYSDKKRRKILFESLKEKGFVEDFDISLIGKEGNLQRFSITSKFLYDKNNKPCGIVGSMISIEARKKAEDELKQLLNTLEIRVKQRTEELLGSEELYYTTVNSFDSWVFVIDELQKILFLNTPLKHFFYDNGLRLDMTGMHIKDIFKFLSEENFSQYIKVFNDHINSEREGEFEVFGKKYYLQIKLSPIIRDNKVIRVVTTVHDYTKLKLIEKEINKNLEREKELNILKSQFISTVSHEFRTPLAGIQSSIQLLERYSEKFSEEKKKKIFKQIFDSIKHTIILLDDVSLVNKGESQNITMKPSMINLEKILLNIIEENKQVYNSSSEIVTTFNLSEKQYFLDQEIIRHIIGNIISNAIKYGVNTKKIIFNVTEKNDEILFNVIDHGIGIPKADQKLLFEPFHRASNVGVISGTGFGLSIVKRFVDMFNGKIEIKSEIGKGTSVIVKIPYRKSAMI